MSLLGSQQIIRTVLSRKSIHTRKYYFHLCSFLY